MWRVAVAAGAVVLAGRAVVVVASPHEAEQVIRVQRVDDASAAPLPVLPERVALVFGGAPMRDDLDAAVERGIEVVPPEAGEGVMRDGQHFSRPVLRPQLRRHVRVFVVARVVRPAVAPEEYAAVAVPLRPGVAGPLVGDKRYERRRVVFGVGGGDEEGPFVVVEVFGVIR